MSLFQQSSFFDQLRVARPKDEPASKSQQSEISPKQLEDWCHAIQSAADEAGDNHLAALESSLLDLRDEILVVLHAHI